MDKNRKEAVKKRKKIGKQTARENIKRLTEDNDFFEYGDLVFAAQRSRRTISDLIENTPADGLITGISYVNSEVFDSSVSKTAIMHYDYMVLAGTQGMNNHQKLDRMIGVTRNLEIPLVFFCEGGGGRPGDVDAGDQNIAGLNIPSFHDFARLSGVVPLVGIGSGRLFAGNAALLGCCDVIIATSDLNLGMGGPAMIEGGGLGVFKPEEVGPSSVQYPNGVIDILVDDEIQAVEAAKKYLSYFQGDLKNWKPPQFKNLRNVIPENRLEVYDVHDVINLLADIGTVQEIKGGFAKGIFTGFIRVKGKPLGVIANNPLYLAGAIDSNCADKAARFMQLCDNFDIPILSLCDTPGMMVGPDVEKTALVRHCSRMFLVGANVSVPMMTVILRKAYGLGAQAMAGGSFMAPNFVAGWPTAEIGAMGLEGAVKLGYRKELEAVSDEKKKQELFNKLVEDLYEKGKSINAASVLEFDTVLDPAETRGWISIIVDGRKKPEFVKAKKKYIDAW
jgi:acetyl-CoA carboxylase carboxyltransferase component